MVAHRLVPKLAHLALLAALASRAALAQPQAQPAKEAPEETAPESADPGQTAAWFEKQVAALDSDDFKTRDAATRELATDPRCTLSVIESRLADQDHKLSPEQNLRLSEAGLRMFSGTPRAAMGVSFATLYNDNDGVKVGGTVDSFDSKRVLKAGDIIREMDGVSLAVNNAERAHSLIISLIISHDPGDEVGLSVLRAGEPVNVRLRLGNYKDLRQANALDGGRMHEAWQFRCARNRGTRADLLPEATDAGLSAQRWAQVAEQLRRGMRHIFMGQQQANAFAVQTDAQDDAAVALVGGGSLRQLLSEPPGDFSASEKASHANGRAQQLQQQIDSLNAQIKVFELQLHNQNTPDAERRRLTVMISQYKSIVSQCRAERRRVLGLVEP